MIKKIYEHGDPSMQIQTVTSFKTTDGGIHENRQVALEEQAKLNLYDFVQETARSILDTEDVYHWILSNRAQLKSILGDFV